MSSLQKSLSGMDNIVTVTGPVGVGKTTLVNRALETNKAHQMVATIGRMRLAPDEVLELLLAGFGVSRQPTGTVQRFAAFKRILTERAKANIRIVIVVEDALRIGNDALLELEALTTGDAGDVGGANVVLMGSPALVTEFNKPELARLKQRSRVGQIVEPFNYAELQGYLKHVLRLVEGDFDTLFADGATAMIYRCSEGIPRVVNSICDAALHATAEAGQNQISRELVQQVAADVYDLRPTLDEPEPLPSVVSEPIVVTRDAGVEPVIDEREDTPAEATTDSAVIVEQQQSTSITDATTAADEQADQVPSEPPEIELPVAAESEHDESLPDIEKAASAVHGLNVPGLPVADPEPILPPVVAAALAQEHEESMSEPTNEFPKVTLADISGDNQLIADTGMNPQPAMIEDVIEDLIEDNFDENQLIADTGMNLSPRHIDDNQLIADTGMNVIPVADLEPADEALAADAEPVAEVEPPLLEKMPEEVPALDALDAPVEEDLPLVEDAVTTEPRADALEMEEPDQEIPPEFQPDPELEIAGSQLASNDLPTLQPAASDEANVADEPAAVDDEPQEEILITLEPEPTAIIKKPNIDAPDEIIESTSVIRQPDFTKDIDASAVDLDEPSLAVTDHSHPVAEQSANGKPEPDLDALQAAISAARRSEPAPEVVAEKAIDLKLDEADTSPATPDDVAENFCDEPDIPHLTLDQTLEDQRKEGAKLDEMAAELADADSLEDISDVMAETLFGIEFEQIAADAIANPPAEGTVPGDEPDDVIAEPAAPDISQSGPSANDPVSEQSPVMLEPELTVPPSLSMPKSSAPEPSQRAVAMPAAQNTSVPESIEDQIQTSITQTLKALKPEDMPFDDDDDDDEPKGLFGRFKKSLGR